MGKMVSSMWRHNPRLMLVRGSRKLDVQRMTDVTKCAEPHRGAAGTGQRVNTHTTITPAQRSITLTLASELGVTHKLHIIKEITYCTSPVFSYLRLYVCDLFVSCCDQSWVSQVCALVQETPPFPQSLLLLTVDLLFWTTGLSLLGVLWIEGLVHMLVGWG